MPDKLMGLGGWLKNSFIDFPGTVSTVLFFSGCNLRCPYCHNAELIRRTVDESLRADEVWEFLESRKGLVEGVVFSGGEPTLYPRLSAVSHEMRTMGYRIKLDTNGLLPDVAASFEPDYLALDIKTAPASYQSLLGAPFENVESRLMQSLDVVRSMGKNAEVRITAAPHLVSREIARQLQPLLHGIARVFLQPMNQSVPLLDPAYNTIAPLANEEIEDIRTIISQAVGECRVRGTSAIK